jgi:hypothetical protein
LAGMASARPMPSGISTSSTQRKDQLAQQAVQLASRMTAEPSGAHEDGVRGR